MDKDALRFDCQKTEVEWMAAVADCQDPHWLLDPGQQFCWRSPSLPTPNIHLFLSIFHFTGVVSTVLDQLEGSSWSMLSSWEAQSGKYLQDSHIANSPCKNIPASCYKRTELIL